MARARGAVAIIEADGGWTLTSVGERFGDLVLGAKDLRLVGPVLREHLDRLGVVHETVTYP